MASVVDIVNNALDMLGARPVMSLTDATEEAAIAKRMWPISRLAVFQEHPWSELIKRKRLARLLDAPVYGFTYAYQLPDDHLKTLEVYLDSATNNTGYQVEAGRILTDADEAMVRYVADVEDSSKYSPLLVQALSGYLAIQMCEPVTQSNTKKDAVYAWYNECLMKAKHHATVEQPPSMIEEDSWIMTRMYPV